MEKWEWYFCLWFLFINFLGFCLMGIDKHRARRGKWRVKEAFLFGTALLGGAMGCFSGMYFFHHKTRHAAFVWGIPAILLLHLGLFAFLVFK